MPLTFIIGVDYVNGLNSSDGLDPVFPEEVDEDELAELAIIDD